MKADLIRIELQRISFATVFGGKRHEKLEMRKLARRIQHEEMRPEKINTKKCVRGIEREEMCRRKCSRGIVQEEIAVHPIFSAQYFCTSEYFIKKFLSDKLSNKSEISKLIYFCW